MSQNRQFFVPFDLEIWRMTLKNNRTPLLCYFKICASFHTHLWNQNKVSLETPNLGQNRRFFFLCDLEILQMTLKTTGHLFYATSSFVHHLIAICEIKMKLQSGNTTFGSKSAIFLSRVTLKFDERPWKTIGHLSYAISSFAHHFIAICEFKMELQSGKA